jgi:hypothetical protein
MNIISEVSGAEGRNGEPLKVHPRRSRYTIATTLLRDGVRPTDVAYILDQNNIDSLKFYTKNIADFARKLNDALALPLGNLAKIFMGKLVDKEVDAVGGDRPNATRILYKDGMGGATCAVEKKCGVNAMPMACYCFCPHFQPWLEGPHKQYLIELINKYNNMVDLKIHKHLMFSVFWAIVGVVQVIQKCEIESVRLKVKCQT